jgi:hypothetical protein
MKELQQKRDYTQSASRIPEAELICNPIEVLKDSEKIC